MHEDYVVQDWDESWTLEPPNLSDKSTMPLVCGECHSRVHISIFAME